MPGAAVKAHQNRLRGVIEPPPVGQGGGVGPYRPRRPLRPDPIFGRIEAELRLSFAARLVQGAHARIDAGLELSASVRVEVLTAEGVKAYRQQRQEDEEAALLLALEVI